MIPPAKSAVDLLREIRSQLGEGSPPLIAPSESSGESVSWRLSAAGPGWATLRSQVLGKTIVFLRDEGVVLPPEAARFVSYTRSELEVLRLATAATLKEIHSWKRALGGRVEGLNTDGVLPPAAESVAP